MRCPRCRGRKVIKVQGKKFCETCGGYVEKIE